jgi:hypothetical protein
MSNVKKLMMTAAGGGDITHVEDVFNAYTYRGYEIDGTVIDNNIALADGLGGGTSTEFDGSSYLSRSTDLSGNTDGKTFTASFWIYREANEQNWPIYFRQDSSDGSGNFYVRVNDTGMISFGGYNTGNTEILYGYSANYTVPLHRWSHIVISVDLSNSSNRHVYLNDTAVSTTYALYNNQNLDFTSTILNVGKNPFATYADRNKKAHVYLDYTYRNLSTTSNRRLFIDANGGSTSPSTLSALNPIIYLPMTEDYSIGENLGTGGDFTSNGLPVIVNNGTEYQSGYGQGGTVWIKSRTSSVDHIIGSTEQGANNHLKPNSTQDNDPASGYITGFLSNGFELGTQSRVNNSSNDYVAWCFRKCPKFHDVVTWTGNGTAGRTISHNLGSAVGMILVKRTDATGNWRVWVDTGSNDYAMFLNGTSAGTSPPQAVIFGNGTSYVAPTSTEFTVGSSADLNASGGTYVAYLFANNDGDGTFGETGDQDIIKCGSYIGTGSTNENFIDLGFEPQYVLIKNVSGSGDWVIVDSSRVFNGDHTFNADIIEISLTTETGRFVNPRADGFSVSGSYANTNSSSNRYFYMAIRKDSPSTPTKASDVFTTSQQWSGWPNYKSSFKPDAAIRYFTPGSSAYPMAFARTFGEKYITTNTNGAASGLGAADWFPKGYGHFIGGQTTDAYSSMWRNAPSFFDVAWHRGSGSNVATNIKPHNLRAKPDMIWVKSVNTTNDWVVWHKDMNYNLASGSDPYVSNKAYARLDTTHAATLTSNYWSYSGNLNFTDENYSLGSTYAATNDSNNSYMAWLFGSLDGVSKAGGYTGNGGSLSIDCGFSNGPAWVMIKAVSRTGSWWVFDEYLGITSGTDPAFRLDNVTGTTTASTIQIAPTSSGFSMNTSYDELNENGASYIYYAIAK